MGLDLLSLNEILNTAAAQTKMTELKTELGSRTGSTWASDIHQCGAPSVQHVGYLWKTSRATLDNFADVPEMNGAFVEGTPNACVNNLRPGRYARVRSTATNGVTFNSVSVHMDSGVADRDFQNRRKAVARIPSIEVGGTPIVDLDRDILVLGDFNTMGRDEAPAITEAQEIATLDGELSPAFRRMAPNLACSEYFKPDRNVERQEASLPGVNIVIA